MKRRTVSLLLLLAAAVLLLWWFRWRTSDQPPTPLQEPTVGLQSGAGAPAEEASVRELWSATLYWPGERRLEREELELESEPGTEAHLRTLLGRLLETPDRAPFRGRARLRTLLLTPEGTAYVDLASPEGAPPPPMGSAEELLSVYSLVHSVLDSAPEVSRVVLLWNGTQRLSLSGHVDLSRPLERFPGLQAP